MSAKDEGMIKETAQKRVIVVVDDDADFLDQFNEMLNLSGYETEIFKNGDEALSYIQTKRPSLVLLDLKMEGTNGWDVTARLKEDPATADIPIIIVSAHYTDEQYRQLKDEHGVQRCFLKPCKPLDIISEIENVFVSEQ